MNADDIPARAQRFTDADVAAIEKMAEAMQDDDFMSGLGVDRTVPGDVLSAFAAMCREYMEAQR